MNRLALASLFLLSYLASAEEGSDVFVIHVPQTQLRMKPFEPPITSPVDLEFAIGSYFPSGLSRSSRVANVSLFRQETPQLSINQLAELYNSDATGIQLTSKLGVSYEKLTRTFPGSGGAVPLAPAHQDLHLLMARIGVELGASRLLPWGFEPVFALNLLPTWAFASDSILEDNFSATGFPIEWALGIRWHQLIQSSRIGLGFFWQNVNGSAGGMALGAHAFQWALTYSL